jgi:hypothetical protein
MSPITSLVKLFWITEEDPSPWSVALWRLGVSAFMTASVIFVIWALGGMFHINGFALADDVDTKIEQAVKPINDKLETIETAQIAQNGYLEQLVKSDFAVRIDREVRARCSATTREEKERIKSAVDTYQEGYKKVAGEDYDEPECSEL